MRIRKIFLFIIVFLVINFLGYAQEDSILTELIDEALKNNPQIQVAYNNWKAAQYRVTQVKTLPDPTVRYTYYGENVETRVGPQEKKYGVSQKIPFSGKLSLKGKAQSKQAAIL